MAYERLVTSSSFKDNTQRALGVYQEVRFTANTTKCLTRHLPQSGSCYVFYCNTLCIEDGS